MAARVCICAASAQHWGLHVCQALKPSDTPNQPNSQLAESETFKEETPRGILGDMEQIGQLVLKKESARGSWVGWGCGWGVGEGACALKVCKSFIVLHFTLTTIFSKAHTKTFGGFIV